MLTTYRLLFDILSREQRRRGAGLLAMILLMGLIDMAGVASILPFLALLANSQLVQENAILRQLSQQLNIADAQSFLIFLGACTFAFIVFGQCVKATTVYAMRRFAARSGYLLGCRVLAKYLSQPYEWFLNQHSADLGKTVLAEVDKVVTGVLIPALQVLAQSVVTLFLVGLLLLVNPGAAIAGAIVIGGAYGVLFAGTRRYLARIGADRLAANRERYQITQEAFGGVKDVKLLGLESDYVDRFRGPAARLAERQAAAAVLSELPRFFLEAVVFGTMMAFLLVQLAAGGGQLATILPMIGVFAFAGARLFPALQQLYKSATDMRFNHPALAALHRDLQERDGPSAREPRASRRISITDHIELRDVTYRYPGAARPSLNAVDLTIPARSTVALVGATGAGKTTAVDVILGLLEPQDGGVEVDGVRIDHTNRRRWQRALGYVPQSIFLTDDTVAANIALGVAGPDVDMAAVEKAARIAAVHEFVTSELPDGYATVVGERGVRLSGGQRQRIGIARALYHDPDVLVFDEATSALDNLTERAVMDAIASLQHAKTIILIAHRFTSLGVCDTIYVLDEGSVQESGTYGELSARGAHFAQLENAAR